MQKQSSQEYCYKSGMHEEKELDFMRLPQGRYAASPIHIVLGIYRSQIPAIYKTNLSCKTPAMYKADLSCKTAVIKYAYNIKQYGLKE